MVKAIFDTCIIIDYLNGIDAAKNELEKYKQKGISVITWMEVLVGTNSQTEARTKNWLSLTFDTVELTKAISQRAIDLRKTKRVKLPDAIIYGTALEYGGILVTRNTKNFDVDDPVVRVPYKL